VPTRRRRVASLARRSLNASVRYRKHAGRSLPRGSRARRATTCSRVLPGSAHALPSRRPPRWNAVMRGVSSRARAL
jgi:hypothetical protein